MRKFDIVKKSDFYYSYMISVLNNCNEYVIKVSKNCVITGVFKKLTVGDFIYYIADECFVFEYNKDTIALKDVVIVLKNKNKKNKIKK